MPAHRTRVERACVQCAVPFYAYPSKIKRGQGRFCSNACSRLGRINAPEVIWARGVRTDSGCLEWHGASNGAGYGQIRIDNVCHLTHRLAWELTYGPIPDGLWVLHRCDNPPCFEPSHLFLGTHADNMADMADKGRQWLQDSRRRWRGEGHPSAVLNENDVREIQRLRAQGMILKDIAARFGVHLSTVYLIVARKNWSHVL